jgi:hypothetical protein
MHYGMERDDAFEVMKSFFGEEFKILPDINSQNKKKQTLLHIACLKKDSLELVDFLLNKGANPNIQDEDGNTCLHLLAENSESKGTDKVFQLCLDWGARLEIFNNKEKLSNHLTSNDEFQRMMMEHKFDLNKECTGGDIEIGLSWKNLNDLDLHCHCRCGNHIYFSSKKCENCKGFLDFDMNATISSTDPNVTSRTPVEHIYWPHLVPGKFLICADFYRNHQGVELESEYFIFVNVRGDLVYKTKGTLNCQCEKEQHKVFAFEVKDKEFKIINIEEYDVKPAQSSQNYFSGGWGEQLNQSSSRRGLVRNQMIQQNESSNEIQLLQNDESEMLQNDSSNFSYQ